MELSSSLNPSKALHYDSEIYGGENQEIKVKFIKHFKKVSIQLYNTLYHYNNYAQFILKTISKTSGKCTRPCKVIKD